MSFAALRLRLKSKLIKQHLEETEQIEVCFSLLPEDFPDRQSDNLEIVPQPGVIDEF